MIDDLPRIAGLELASDWVNLSRSQLGDRAKNFYSTDALPFPADQLLPFHEDWAHGDLVEEVEHYAAMLKISYGDLFFTAAKRWIPEWPELDVDCGSPGPIFEPSVDGQEVGMATMVVRFANLLTEPVPAGAVHVCEADSDKLVAALVKDIAWNEGVPESVRTLYATGRYYCLPEVLALKKVASVKLGACIGAVLAKVSWASVEPTRLFDAQFDLHALHRTSSSLLAMSFWRTVIADNHLCVEWLKSVERAERLRLVLEFPEISMATQFGLGVLVLPKVTKLNVLVALLAQGWTVNQSSLRLIPSEQRLHYANVLSSTERKMHHMSVAKRLVDSVRS